IQSDTIPGAKVRAAAINQATGIRQKSPKPHSNLAFFGDNTGDPMQAKLPRHLAMTSGLWPAGFLSLKNQPIGPSLNVIALAFYIRPPCAGSPPKPKSCHLVTMILSATD